MNTLREEIGFKLLQINDNDILGDVTNDILKLIEKRIDSISLSEYVEGHYQGISLNQIQRDTIAKVKEILK